MSNKTAARYDLEMRNNETFVFRLEYVDANDLPIDLTGATVRMQVRNKPRGTVILDSAGVGGSTSIDGPAGKIEVIFDAPTMIAVTAPSGVYDVALTAADGTIDVILEGAVKFAPGVTL